MAERAPGGSPEGVPLVDLARTNGPLLGAARDCFERIARAGAFALGDDLAAFEEEFAGFCGAGHCVGVSDGTEAIRLALAAAGAGPGRSVVTVPLTFVATVEAVAATGARPVLADVDPETRCLGPAALEAAIRPDTAAVVPVHLHGRPAPMEEIRAVCDRAGVAVIEDAAQAHGASLGGRRAGTLGRAAAFSFYPTKNLGAFGDGGAVVTDDPDLAATVRSLRHHGSTPDDANCHVLRGATGRLDNLQAALLRLKLPLLDLWNGERRAAAELYREELAGAPCELPPGDPADGAHVYHLFAVLVDERDRVREELRADGIGTGVHYPVPVHLQPAWEELGGGAGSFPAAERIAARCLSLPLFPGITPDEVRRVAASLRRALR